MYSKLKLELPILGDVSKKIILARFSRTLAILLASGIPISKSLELVKYTCKNLIIQNLIDDAIINVSNGNSITSPFSSSDYIPTLVCKMMAVGEESGTLEEMLIKIADFYDDEIEHRLTQLGSIIEPVMIIIMMIVIGFIVLSVVLPMVEIWQIF